MRTPLITTLALVLALLAPQLAHARNTPCSGKKGGISHCEGRLFICKNGTVSKSKRSCSAG